MGKGMLLGSRLLGKPDSKLTIAARAMSERNFEDRMVRWFGSLTEAERAEIWNGKASTRSPSRIPFEAAPGASPLRRVLHYDQTSWLPDNLLERMDTMTMAASIEARCPFMDVRLAEFASSLPEDWRIKGRVTKRIVREAMARRLPESVLKRKKIGFRMPVAAWFRGPLQEPFRDRVLGKGAITPQYLDARRVERLLDDHVQQRANHEKTLWSFFTLETFLREFF
jgi:asparagine synthase (glutamine-hydrolysing)